MAVAEPSREKSVRLPRVLVKDRARLLAVRRRPRTGITERIDTGFDPMGVTIFLLDSLLQAGYGYSREQARSGLLNKAMKMPVHAGGSLGFISTAMRGARRRGPSSPSTACSHERKAGGYGESHQKAPQISRCMLPLAWISMLEGALVLPGLRHKRNAWHLLGRVCSFLLLGECFSSHTTAV